MASKPVSKKKDPKKRTEADMRSRRESNSITDPNTFFVKKSAKETK